MISGRSRLTTYDATEKRKPGDDLLGDGGPAEDVPPLEDEGARAAPREVGGRDQAVVATADHDGVVLATGHRGEG